MSSSSRSGPTAVSASGTTSTTSNSPTLSPTHMEGTQSSALYLYAFFASLILLLGISSAIIARSLMLRQRYRRMIAPVSNGSWTFSARVNIDLCKRPQLWDAWVQPSAYAHGGKNEKDVWDGIMPLATYSSSSNKPAPSVPASSASTTPEPLTTSTADQPNVHIAVFITMPAPEIMPTSRTIPTWMPDDYELPHLEVGVVSVGVRNTDGDGAEPV
ncbi:hypothetical protein C8R45DRAFT_411060 [Mycena sanguinolenta]|nr:hypothetical protein C8R45DRAFT_411060 [Mycena sanguinolenta]